MTVRAFVWPDLIRFSKGFMEEYGVWMNLPGILPIESRLELPTPESLANDYDVIEVTISDYRLERSGVLIVKTDRVLFDRSKASEVMPALIEIGWLHACQVWPSPVKEFTPPSFTDEST